MASRWVVTLALLFWLVPVQAQNDTSDRQVWAFYLSFWAGEHTWEWNQEVLIDYPVLGQYNSKMPEVAAAHIAQAQSAGIDAFVVSWFGIQEQVTTTPAFLNLLDRAAEMDFSVGAAIDLFNPQFNRDLDGLIESLRWLMDYAINQPGYLKVQGKPVILFTFQDVAEWDDATWLMIRDTVDPRRQTIWIAEGLSACCLYRGAMDGMYAFNMAWANGSADYYIAERNLVFDRGGSFYIPSISPGWDEDTIATIESRPRPTSRKDREEGRFLSNAWQAAMQTQSPIVLVVTWNEFMENSHIEPSERYGTQSLDMLRQLIISWKTSQTLFVSPVPIPYHVEVDELVAAFTEPDTTSLVAAILEPGRQYVLGDEDSGLYGVYASGQVVYVPYQHIRLVPN